VGVAADVMPLWRWAGLAAAVIATGLVWLRRERFGPVHALGLALGVIVLLGPALRPWYALWAVVLLAAAAPAGRLPRVAAATSVVLTLVVLPNGFAPELADVGQAVLGVVLGLGATVLATSWIARWEPFLTLPRPTAATAPAAYHR
jgi:hypothetical protein